MWFRKEAPEMVNLSLADDKSQNLFKSAVSGHSQVNILVHPFYHEGRMSKVQEVGLPEYRRNRSLMLASRSKDDSPIVIFESVRDFKKLGGVLKSMHMTGLVFTVMTPTRQPVPLDPETMQNPRLIDALQRDLIKKLPPALEERCWDRLIGLLSYKPVCLGGQWLTYFEDEDFTEPNAKAAYESQKAVLTKNGAGSLTDKNGEKLLKLPGFCVGMTALELAARNINVALSLPSWPNVSGKILNDLLKNYGMS